MARQNRETLRGYFKHGALPTEDHFKDLIESTLNMRDEGFSKSPGYGWELYPKDSGQGLISFFSDITADVPDWTVKYDKTNSSHLHLTTTVAELPLFTFTPPEIQQDQTLCRVGVNQTDPEEAVDVGGYVKALGFLGDESFLVLADGRYHDITPTLTGVNGFEVVAALGVQGTDIYGIAHTIALNSGYPARWYDALVSLLLPIYRFWEKWTNNQEDAQSDFFRGRRGIKTTFTKFENGEIRLRWLTRDEGYVLQMKSLCNCKEERKRQSGVQEGDLCVRYHLRQLWKDSSMQGCERHSVTNGQDSQED